MDPTSREKHPIYVIDNGGHYSDHVFYFVGTNWSTDVVKLVVEALGYKLVGVVSPVEWHGSLRTLESILDASEMFVEFCAKPSELCFKPAYLKLPRYLLISVGHQDGCEALVREALNRVSSSEEPEGPPDAPDEHEIDLVRD